MKKFFMKKLIKLYLNKFDKKILDFFIAEDTKLNLCDIGSIGGIQKKWKFFEKLINFHGFEPQDISKNGNFVLSNVSDKNVDLKITRKLQCSSVLEPNFKYLNKFHSSERFEILRKEKFKTITFDRYYTDKKFDFIKIDCEGYELEILQGANKYLENEYVLGLEVECEFFQLRTNQALFWDIKKYLENKDYIFYDFMKIIRWEKDQYTESGQPQITDALFLKNPDKIIDDFEKKKINLDVVLKYYLILTVYNKIDLIRYLNKNLNLNQKNYLEFIKQVTKKMNIINKFRLYNRRFEMLFNREI
jgi:FkbM family methyltransferase